MLYASRGSTCTQPRSAPLEHLVSECKGTSTGAHLCGHPSWHLLGEEGADVHSGFVELASELLIAR